MTELFFLESLTLRFESSEQMNRMNSYGQIINWPEISKVERKGIMDFLVSLAGSSPEPSGHLLTTSLPTINLSHFLLGRLEFLDPSR